MSKLITSLSLLVIITLLTRNACATLPSKVDLALLQSKLNSERIEYFFGSYGIEQIAVCRSNFPDSRISNLYSVKQGKKIMRTFAIVDFIQPISSDLLSSHKKIMAGGSIGATLKSDHWDIIKDPLYFGSVQLPLAAMSWMDESKAHHAAVHIYQLSINNKEHPIPIPYCTIIEVHSPQYLTLEWLEQLYPTEFQTHITSNDDIKKRIALTYECLAHLPSPS